jgi:nucleoporin p58/p45
MKAAYLADQRRRGDGNDPFLEADRRETARQEAAAKRVHPTSHLPTNSQPSTQVAGLLASSGIHGASTAPQTSAATTSASSGSGLSLFGTPASAPSSLPSSLFATPTTSAPVSSLFGSSGATPQTSLFGSSSASLFGSASTSLFSSAAPSFGSTALSGSSLFSTPFASGTFLSFLVL